PDIVVCSTWNVGVYCQYDGAALVNHAEVYAARSDVNGDGRAVWMDADHTTIDNAVDGSILGEFAGVFLSGVDGTMTNEGTIEGYSYGIGCTGAVQDLNVDNSGVIRSEYVGIGVGNASGTIRNSGRIEGTRSEAIAGSLDGGALTIVNDAKG